MLDQQWRQKYRLAIAVIGIIGSIVWLCTDYYFLLVSDITIGKLVNEPQSHQVGTRPRRTEYYIDYIFEVKGKQYQGHDSVAEYPSKPTLVVYYNRSNPGENKAEPPAILMGWLTFGVSVVLLWSTRFGKRASN